MEVPNVKDFQWKRLAPLPSRRVYCSLLETGGQVYAIGGCDDNGVPVDCFEVYSPEADQWTDLRPLPTARAGVAVTALGKRIMVIGGVGTSQLPLKVVEMYTTSMKASGRRGACCVRPPWAFLSRPKASGAKAEGGQREGSGVPRGKGWKPTLSWRPLSHS